MKCKTCNSQVACFSAQYERSLSNGYSIEEALNDLQIMNVCCRAAMKNPTIVTFEMGNREVIEGTKRASDVLYETISPPFELEPFLSRIQTQETQPSLQGRTTIRPLAPKEKSRGLHTGLLSSLSRSESAELSSLLSLAGDISMFNTTLDPGIEVEVEGEEFLEPTIPGFPTINSDRTRVTRTIEVGAGRKVEVLNGRTYLAV